MTQNVERTEAASGWSPAGRTTKEVTTTGPTPRRPWWRQWYPWLVVLGGLVVFNLIHAFPRYLEGDPARSRSMLDPGVSAHFPLLVAHIVTGNIAMVTVLLQLWPWLRRTYPKIHRTSGLVYIFAGALPSAALAVFVLIPLRPDHSGSVGIGTMGVLWLITTVVAYRMARQHRYAEHRRWMLYSFALAMGTTWGRVLVTLLIEFPGMPLSIPVLIEVSSWFGWIFNLLVAHFYVEWIAKRESVRGAEIVTYPSPAR